MEEEMATLERDFRASENDYGKNVLNLTFAMGYIKKLLANSKVARFLKTRHSNISGEFENIAKTESL